MAGAVVVVVLLIVLLSQKTLNDLASLEPPGGLLLAVAVVHLVDVRADDVTDARPCQEGRQGPAASARNLARLLLKQLLLLLLLLLGLGS